MASTLRDIVDSIFTPGTNEGLLRAMNWSFYALFATLSALLVATRGNVHVVALLTLSVALWASIKWCVRAGVAARKWGRWGTPPSPLRLQS